MSLTAIPESQVNDGVQDKERDDVSAATSGSRWSCWFCRGHSQETTPSALVHITLAAAPPGLSKSVRKVIVDFTMLAYPKQTRRSLGYTSIVN